MGYKKKDWLFHLSAPVYDFFIRNPQIDRIVRLMDLPKRGYLLDAGGGTGRVSSHLVDLAAHVVVCDINHSMLKQMKKKKGLIPLLADVTTLPFSAGTFDSILVVDALHHFMNPRRAVMEMLRVIKPGGRLLIEEQDIERTPIKMVQIAERLVQLHSRFLALHEIVTLFDATQCKLHIDRGRCFTFRILVQKLQTNGQ
jgi:demethylmenaquinone methyltransferase/2-methoxy-6-polyprenyl-1,4-benzoquinol methylase